VDDAELETARQENVRFAARALATAWLVVEDKVEALKILDKELDIVELLVIDLGGSHER
jgi:hypothetical protein